MYKMFSLFYLIAFAIKKYNIFILNIKFLTTFLTFFFIVKVEQLERNMSIFPTKFSSRNVKLRFYLSAAKLYCINFSLFNYI